jgi:hypothetical protein
MILESQEKDQLYTALAQAQVEFPTIRVNRKAFKNEYADLYAILKPVYPILNKYGLSIRPWGGLEDGKQLIGARIMHKSGQYETNVFLFEADACKNPNDQVSHKKQGALTYFNRNHMKDMLGVLISDDPEDDDGQGQNIAERVQHPIHHLIGSDHISADQLQEIEHILEGHIDIAKKVLMGFDIKFLAHIPKDQYLKTVDRIRFLKTQYESIKK